ncbi:MAG TPA: VOC family protein [Actinophytocola sp.]|jgi:catechol 2,3-dioxygenase-like lactoylglutathione lyase family enzyme|nr:VOC family protein [Actinophytocola sp.]
MDVSSVTVGLPVADLHRAMEWYRRVFGFGPPDVVPASTVVEFRLGPVWLQLGEAPPAHRGAGTVARFGVADAAAERERLAGLGIEVGALEHVPGAVDYFDFADPDGNLLSFYTVLA